MLKDPAAVEGRETYGVIYADDPAPPGLAARLRARGNRLLVSGDETTRRIGIFLHGLAEADESRAAREGHRHG